MTKRGFAVPVHHTDDGGCPTSMEHRSHRSQLALCDAALTTTNRNPPLHRLTVRNAGRDARATVRECPQPSERHRLA